MSSDTGGRDGNDRPSVDITLRQGEDSEMWIAEDVATGVTSQGPTREAALDNLDEALAGFEGAGEPPTAADLQALGIDPDSNTPSTPTDSDPFGL